eukprot:767517-Hanusia_phi.AAC.6
MATKFHYLGGRERSPDVDEDFESSPHGRHASFLGRCPCPPAPSEVEGAEAPSSTVNQPLSLLNTCRHFTADHKENRSPLKPLKHNFNNIFYSSSKFGLSSQAKAGEQKQSKDDLKEEIASSVRCSRCNELITCCPSCHQRTTGTRLKGAPPKSKRLCYECEECGAENDKNFKSCQICGADSLKSSPSTTRSTLKQELTRAESKILHLQRELAIKSAEIQRLKMEKVCLVFVLPA